ncbi:hypothetical protein SNE35_17660 [Paucibacter sp. R3-3]|uniref:DUF4148 domain-containing protein n=1 Tax=Roseateles agri TaxID=3098619 RepID=A0ABU5DKV8_9BURK|nr:hypothetical protein [Paucibacter sp. R3-3]MDY0746343.1 hypothetical protein [Paucibacter sp. R3-3]
MRTQQFVTLALSLFIGTAAMAHPGHADGPTSRAEVIADLEIYRQSGLAELDGRDEPPVYGADYQAAQARYQALHASPAFAMRVARIAQQRGEAVATASSGAAQSTVTQ